MAHCSLRNAYFVDMSSHWNSGLCFQYQLSVGKYGLWIKFLGSFQLLSFKLRWLSYKTASRKHPQADSIPVLADRHLTADRRIQLPSQPFYWFVTGPGRRQQDPLRHALPQMFINLLQDSACILLLSHQLKLREFKSACSLPEDLVDFLFSSHFLCLMGEGNGSSERNDLLQP